MKKKNRFSKRYPNINWWVMHQGWIALGADDMSYSVLRILDPGGICWEYDDSKSLDEALKKADIWLSIEIEDRLGEVPPKRY